MRIYNATKAQIEMPLGNGTKLVIPSNSVSGEFMPNSTVISVFMTTYKPSDVAFIISGPYEISMLSNFAGSVDYVVNNIEEAVARFAPKEDPTTTTTPAPTTSTTTTSSTTTYSPAAAEKKVTTTTSTTTVQPEVEETVETTTDEPKKPASVLPSQKKVVKTNRKDEAEK